MKQIPVYDLQGKSIGQQEIQEALFKDPVNADVLYQYVVSYRANQRQGNASTKTIAEVSGGGRKPWKQKGTGRARTSSIRNPIWRHGGITFGPQCRDYSVSLPKKIKRKALKESLRDKFQENKVAILSIAELTEPKTKTFNEFLKSTDMQSNKILFVLSTGSDIRETVARSIQNLPKVRWLYDDQLNAYEILNCDMVIVLTESFQKVRSLLGEKNES